MEIKYCLQLVYVDDSFINRMMAFCFSVMSITYQDQSCYKQEPDCVLQRTHFKVCVISGMLRRNRGVARSPCSTLCIKEGHLVQNNDIC